MITNIIKERREEKRGEKRKEERRRGGERQEDLAISLAVPNGSLCMFEYYRMLYHHKYVPFLGFALPNELKSKS